MSKDWDSYSREIDGKAASIFLDLGLADAAPVARLPVLGTVHLCMRCPRQDGLSSADEFVALTAVEDALASQLVCRSTTYVGCITTAGRRDFYFYSAAEQGWADRVAAVLGAYPDYRYTCSTRADREWGTYFDVLSPSHEDRACIRNRRICDDLQQQGDRLLTARPILHWAYFRKAKARQAFVDKVIALGHRVEECVDPEAKGEPFSVRFSGVGVPSHGGIDALTLPLFRAAHECGGEYDGWETEVIH